MNLKTEKIEAQLEKLARLPRSQRIALIMVIVLGVVGAYAYLLYMPARERLIVLEQQEQKLQREVSELKAIVSNLETFQEELAQLERKLALAVRQLPDSKELPVLLTDISSLGKDSGLEFKAFRPRPEVPHDFYAEVPIEIEFSGQYHDIARFFDRVAKLPRIVNVGRLEMKIGKERFDGTRLVVRGQATTFRFLGRAADSHATGAEAKASTRGMQGSGGRA